MDVTDSVTPLQMVKPIRANSEPMDLEKDEKRTLNSLTSI